MIRQVTSIRHFVRSDTLPHLGSCAFLELPLLDVPPVQESPTSVEIARHFSTPSCAWSFLIIKVSDLRRCLDYRFGRLVAFA